MARGRKEQPAEVREAKGNPGKRGAKSVSTDDLPALKSSAPKHLSKAAKVVWDQIVPSLSRMNLMRQSDGPLMERYCEALADFWDATRKLRGGRAAKKSVYEAPMTNGGKMMRINPWFLVQERLAKRLTDMEDRLGMSPRARQEILYRMSNVAPQQPDLPLGSTQPEGERASATADPLGLNPASNGQIH